MAIEITGGCQCGNIRYALSAEPEFSLYCYCRDCQRSTGSDRFAGVMFTEAALRIAQGEPAVFVTHGVSGRKVGRKFCPDCSSMLWGETEMGLVSICAGTLDDTRIFKPTMAVFTEDAPEHAVIPTELIPAAN